MNGKLIAMLLVVVFAAGIGVVLGVAASGDDGPKNAPMPATIVTVSGGATVQTEPDKATVTLSVITDAATSEDALTQNADKSQAVMKSLKGDGVAEDDIQTTQLSVNKHYQDRGTKHETVSYRAENQVTVIIHDLPKVGDIIDGAVLAGANDVHGVEFGLSDVSASKSEALAKAVLNARTKAATLAKAAGATLGPVVRIDEQSYRVNDYQQRLVAMDAFVPAASPAPTTPVSPGQVETTVEVQVVFELEV